MNILNEYLSYLDEEEKEGEEKKSKWKDRLKKYGKVALGAAAVGAAAYAGNKAYEKHKYSKTLSGKLSNKYKSVVSDYKKNKAAKTKVKAQKKADKEQDKADRLQRNKTTTASKYKRWKKERERAQDKITRDRWLNKLQSKVKGDEGKKPGFFKKWKDKRKEKGIVKKLKYKVGLD